MMKTLKRRWIPACAGMTDKAVERSGTTCLLSTAGAKTAKLSLSDASYETRLQTGWHRL